MSVLVKGMEMPKRCLECNMMIADEQDYCSVTMHDLCFSDYYAYVKPSWCPLVEVPDDVQPVVHGKWVYCSIDDMFHCTRCDAAAVRNSFVYCPICGAKMDGEE